MFVLTDELVVQAAKKFHRFYTKNDQKWFKIQQAEYQYIVT